MNTSRVRKQVSDLTDADFSLSAILEFALDEEGSHALVAGGGDEQVPRSGIFHCA
jgi:hypothetical protein